MSIAKQASLLGLGPDATAWQITEAIRNLIAQRDTYRELAEREPFGLRPTRWEVVGEGEMVAHGAKAWHVVRRQVQEGRKVRVWLRGIGDKDALRTYDFDEVIDVLTPTVETAVLAFLRRELDARILSPEEHAQRGAA